MINGKNGQKDALKKQALMLMNSQQLEEAKARFAQICELDPDDADAWYALSNINGMLGRIDEAGECCRRVLALRPDHCEAHINLGNVFLSQGQDEAAAAQYQKALQINSNHAVAHFSLGNLLSAKGKYDEAAASYQAAIKNNPNMAIAYFNLGNVRMLQGQYDKAVNNYKQATLIDPAAPQLTVVKEQGRILAQNNRHEEAKALFSHLCQINSRDIQAWHALGIIHGSLGELEEAGECCRRILAIQPDHDEAHVNLGHIFFQRGQFDDAIAQYQQALKTNPRSVAALNNMGKACQTEEHFGKYIEHYRKSIAVMSDPSEARTNFFLLIRKRVQSEYDSWLDKELQDYFAMTDVEHRPLIEFTLNFLKLKHHIQSFIDDAGNVSRDMVEQIASDKLFLVVLEKAVNTDADVEVLLRKVRRALLLKYCSEKGLSLSESRLAYALACQGHNNEYVFVADEEEERRISELRRVIEQSVPSMSSPNVDLESRLSVFGMYERLSSLSCRELLGRLPLAEWSDAFRPLLIEALVNPIEEENIKREIVALGDVVDQTSQLVQSQYEENPYPRWVSTFKKRHKNIGLLLQQIFPHFTPPAFLDGPIEILVAGCGTGQHPINVALKFDNVEVLAVDISKSSLAYATRMARKNDVKNIKFMQGDILDLAKLNRRFHIIECAGVLHHMEDPLAGWRVLTKLLVDNGLMAIGLYSELARRGVVEARRIIKKMALTPDRNTIRNFRERILRREFGDLMYERMRYCCDLYSTSGCRDLLFHYQEHRYTLPQLNKELNELNLDFIGFIFDDIKYANAYRNLFPEDGEMTNLLLWDRFENMYPNTFGGMYNFWCQNKRKDA